LIDGESSSQTTSHRSTCQVLMSSWQRCYHDDVDHGVMSLPSHVDNDATEETGPRCDVDVESC
jgi:hypothetical protein